MHKTASKMLSLAGPTSAKSQLISKSWFGADCNNSFGSVFGKPTLQDGAGNPAVLQTIRFWDNGLKWTQIHSAPITFNWGAMDNWVNAAIGAGCDIIYVFGATPTFIASTTNGAGCSNAGSFTNNCCPPTDVGSDGTTASGTDATFKLFVTTLVTRYKGRIKYYELWNEQDSGNFWNGTMQQAVRMGQDAAAIIRSLDPAAIIISPSFHGPTAATFFVNYCTTSVNGIAGWKNFSVVNVHMRASDTNQAGNKNANVDPTCFFNPYNQTLAALQTLKGKGIDLTQYPLWDDENGYIPAQGGSGYPPPITDPFMFAAYVAVGVILRASVLQKNCYYCWTSPQQFEQLQSASAGTAWNTVANLIIGKTVNSSIPATGYSQGNNVFGSPVYTVTVNNGQGMFVWDQSQSCTNASGNEVCTFSPFKYPSGYTKWADIFGNTGNLSGGTVQIGCCPLFLS